MSVQSRGRAGITACLLAAVLILPGAAQAASTTYTSNADFDLGTLDGVNHASPNDHQLQLNVTGTTFSVLWVANAGHDTVSKIDTATPSGFIPSGGCEVARYRTWFGTSNHGAWEGPAPSRTAVDVDGNVYVLNRHFDGRKAQVMKILAEGGIDRNGNGTIDTSSDANGDCQISSGEMAPVMVDSNGNGLIDPSELTDERIAWVVTVGANNGLGRSLCIGTDGHIWVGLYNARQYYKISSANGGVLAGPIGTSGLTPYGCLVDAQGRLWSANLGNQLGELNTNTNTWTANHGSPWWNYGIALGNNRVYLGSSTHQYNPATNTFSSFAGNPGTLGLSVDGNGDIILGQGGARKYTPAGALMWSTTGPGASDTRGVVPDQNNDVWIVNRGSNNVMKFRGSDGLFLGTLPVGREPYTYSDATGFAARNVTTPTGTWTVVEDSGDPGATWTQVSWTDSVPAGASTVVRVRAASTEAGLALQPYITVSNGGDPGLTGQYMQVQVRLTANTEDASPILYDLTVAWAPSNQPPIARCQDVTVAAGATCNAPASVNDGSTDPDADPITLAQSPAGPYGLGQTPVTLTVTDDMGAYTSCSATVTVADQTGPAVTCPAPVTVECTSPSGADATFSASATDNCPAVSVSCPASGSSFPLGTTSVGCSATDSSGNSASCTSSVTVVDTKAPAITCPAPLTVECTANGSATATLTATAADVCDGTVPASCSGAGSSFPLGTTTVQCSAADASANSVSCPASVTVVDTTPPTVACVPSFNPSGKHIPVALNEDGFYKVSGSDSCTSAGIRLGGFALANGETIKLTQTPGKSGVRFVGTMGPAAIKHFQVGPADAVIVATDGSGNQSSVTCLVPPPPK